MYSVQLCHASGVNVNADMDNRTLKQILKLLKFTNNTMMGV